MEFVRTPKECAEYVGYSLRVDVRDYTLWADSSGYTIRDCNGGYKPIADRRDYALRDSGFEPSCCRFVHSTLLQFT